ncbi:LysR family transcriptional regulator [Colwellia sp. 1_MG-2023]|uniref:LysR family transcriptional regulator n=1 Tax=Colwellia sp. 1_MG-2023 TaxID=3062649 RepID=UPI0026E3E533|nr:LysR family transcriptional regulator [Colwellia sp. 1_MG-2023]MDO6445424.1 LysR family transcriptional regulator [Colwellia sp. 1_MG-2023]
MLLEDLNIVLRVAEFKSITAAAESMNMRTATASVAIKRVERELGAELFIRTTRRLRLSTAGERYIPQCMEGLNALNIAKQNVRTEKDVISGELRLSVPSDLGRNIILPWLDEFTEEHQDIKLSIHIADRNIDLYKDSVDIAIRYGSLVDENLYGFKICDVRRVLCAAPLYIERYGQPKIPQDITEHNALLYQLHELVDSHWRFSRNNETFKVKAVSNRKTNDADLVRRWCIAGKGLAKKSCLDMSNDLLAKKVVRVMKDYEPTSTELWIVCPSRQTITPAVRLLRDFLKKKTNDVINKLTENKIL